jgi:hypothetical protein
VGRADLNYLSAYFLEKSRDNPEAITAMIEWNRQVKGWLIFATHDVDATPTRWGCTPGLFEEIVRCSVASGARVLPVYPALNALAGVSAGPVDVPGSQM